MAIDHYYTNEELRAARAFIESPLNTGKYYASPVGDLVFDLVRGDQEENVIDSLSRLRGDDTWDFDCWIRDAMFYPGFITLARRAFDCVPVGFIAFDVSAFITDARDPSAPNQASLSLKFQPLTAYVSPSFRGHGISSSLAAHFRDQCAHTLDNLAEASTTILSHLEVTTVRTAIESECVSEEGARLAAKLSLAASETVQNRHGEIGRWSGLQELEDAVDFGDWPQQREKVTTRMSDGVPISPR